MEKWYEPDPIWEAAFDVNCREDYIEKYGVIGHFHKNVPEDVKKAFITVEYLAAHSYYHYPMLDEAVKKTHGILEMAIKFRCAELGISLTIVNKRGESYDRRLSDLIDSLDDMEPLKHLKSGLHRLREIRNAYAHPSDHSFGGALVRPQIFGMINAINAIFQDESALVQDEKQIIDYQAAFPTLANDLLILEVDKKRILVTGAKPVDVAIDNDSIISLWKFDPVLVNVRENFPEYNFTFPIIAVFKDANYCNGVLEATDVKFNRVVRIVSTSDSKNIEKLNTYRTDLESLAANNRAIFKNSCSSFIASNRAQFIYDYYWK